MTPQEEALEAAKLAAMVSSQLNIMDKMFTERSNNPANKINMNDFVKRVKNPNAPSGVSSYLQTPAGFAPPPPEDYIQSVIPDVSIGSRQQPVIESIPIASVQNTDVDVNVKLHPLPKPPEGSVNLPHIIKSEQEAPKIEFREDIKPLLTRSDIDSIRNSLKNIDKSLSGMLNLLKNSKLTNNE